MTLAQPGAVHWRASDLRAAVLLATQGTQGVVTVVEGVHQSVWRTLGAPAGPLPGQTRGVTGLVYRSIQGVTSRIGLGLAGALAHLESKLAHGTGADPADSADRLALLAVLNGVMGDRLAATTNPLALPMTLQVESPLGGLTQPLALERPLDLQVPGASPRVLLVLHGLCRNDLQWTVVHRGRRINHAQALADALGCTPVYVRYNTGLHIAANGERLAQQLECLLQRWPQSPVRLTVLAHSMGGLVMRSAVAFAQDKGLRWPAMLQHIVFLGTPHHGAPLERAGNGLDVLLDSTPYSRPLARLGQLRSAGITDLRHGVVRAADGSDADRFRPGPDPRTPQPLPPGVACYAIAASLAGARGKLAQRLLGDGLVPLRSALGQHDDPRHTLNFAPQNQRVLTHCGHLQLLSHPRVRQQLLRWLA